MRILLLTLLGAVALQGTDARKLSLESAAQADFDRVLTLGAPDLAAASKCVQSQAMLLAIAEPGEAPEIGFRKGYCELANAVITQDRAIFGQAAETFDHTIADGEAASPKQKTPFHAPPTWRILASIARLNAGAPPESQEQSLSQAVDADSGDSSDCRLNAAAVEFCHSVHQLGSAWLGWIALKRGDLGAAGRRFADGNAPGWREWIAGTEAFRLGNYGGASTDWGQAIGKWRAARADFLEQRMNPKPMISEALTDWGGAQLAANDLGPAVATLDEAVKADSGNPRALYLRGLTMQHLGRNDAAFDDLNLASRAAFAKSGDAGAAEAHFYRGISLYWRKEFTRAENEFTSAMNAGIAGPWLSEARTWRLLAAVAGGACGDSRRALESAMTSISPFFPKTEARAASAACPATASLNTIPGMRTVVQFP